MRLLMSALIVMLATPALAGGNMTVHKNDVGMFKVIVDQIAPECDGPCDVNEGLDPQIEEEPDWSLPEQRIAMAE